MIVRGLPRDDVGFQAQGPGRGRGIWKANGLAFLLQVVVPHRCLPSVAVTPGALDMRYGVAR
jgi:hypothetical protein